MKSVALIPVRQSTAVHIKNWDMFCPKIQKAPRGSGMLFDRIRVAYYARFADFFFFGAAFFVAFFADFFATFFAAFFFAAIKIFLLCKSESVCKIVFMITTMINTLYT